MKRLLADEEEEAAKRSLADADSKQPTLSPYQSVILQNALEIERHYAFSQFVEDLSSSHPQMLTEEPDRLIPHFLFILYATAGTLPVESPLLPIPSETSLDFFASSLERMGLDSQAARSHLLETIDTYHTTIEQKRKTILSSMPWYEVDEASAIPTLREATSSLSFSLDFQGFHYSLPSHVVRSLHQRYTQTSGAPIALSCPFFRSSLFRLVCRYGTLSEPPFATGLQISLSPAVMHALRLALGVEAEAFASPLNATLPSFHSCMPDVDTAFGSKGNWFELAGTEGGFFEVNPPFVEGLMVLLADTLLTLLSKDTAFSFLLCFPAWRSNPSPSVERLVESSFFLASSHMLLPGDGHWFCPGNKHLRLEDKEEEPIAIQTDVQLFILQNEAGREKWPITESMMENLRNDLHIKTTSNNFL